METIMKKKKKYKSNYALKGRDTQEIADYLDTLCKLKGGELTPDEVLQDAKKRSSLLHGLFDWDDNQAAQKWRMHQARLLLNGIVEVVEIQGVETKMRSFYNVHNTKQERVYVTLETATTNQNYVKQLLNDCEGYIEHFLSVIKLLKQRIK